jgi:hypothetical protein
MTEEALEKLKYPIGRFNAPESSTQQDRMARIAILENLPSKLDKTLEGFSDVMLDTPYREGGWTVRQLVHHIADSHMNSLIRFKFALTEDRPKVMGYKQDAWARMNDAMTLPPEVSQQMIHSIHQRLTTILRGMGEAEFARGLQHSEHDHDLTLDYMLALYAWHSEHHLAHIENLKERNNW